MSRIALIVLGTIVTAFTVASSGMLKKGEYFGDAVIIGSDGMGVLMLGLEIGPKHSAVLTTPFLTTQAPAPPTLNSKWMQEDATHYVADFSKAFTELIQAKSPDPNAMGIMRLRFKAKSQGLKGKQTVSTMFSADGVHISHSYKTKFLLPAVQ